MKGEAASCFSSTFTVPVQTLCQVHIPGVSSLHCPSELSSLEEIEEMDRQRLQVIESLKISDDSWLSGPSGKQRDKIAGNNSLSVGAVTNTV